MRVTGWEGVCGVQDARPVGVVLVEWFVYEVLNCGEGERDGFVDVVYEVDYNL